MSWEIPKEVNKKNTWSVITYPDYHVVVPTVDSKPHEIESLTCPCGARTELTDGFPMIIHDSWRDKERIAASLSKIF